MARGILGGVGHAHTWHHFGACGNFGICAQAALWRCGTGRATPPSSKGAQSAQFPAPGARGNAKREAHSARAGGSNGAFCRHTPKAGLQWTKKKAAWNRLSRPVKLRPRPLQMSPRRPRHPPSTPGNVPTGGLSPASYRGLRGPRGGSAGVHALGPSWAGPSLGHPHGTGRSARAAPAQLGRRRAATADRNAGLLQGCAEGHAARPNRRY